MQFLCRTGVFCLASIPCCRLFSILPRSSWEPARVCIPETCAHSCAELPLPPSRQCEQPATSQVQATLLPSGCPCPNRALAAQQARHHSIISPESSCGPLKVDAVEPCPEPCSVLPFVAMPLVLLCCGFWAACWAASRALRTSGFSSPASYRIVSISCFVCKENGCHSQKSRLW